MSDKMSGDVLAGLEIRAHLRDKNGNDYKICTCVSIRSWDQGDKGELLAVLSEMVDRLRRAEASESEKKKL